MLSVITILSAIALVLAIIALFKPDYPLTTVAIILLAIAMLVGNA